MNNYHKVLDTEALANLRDVVGGDDIVLFELIRSFLEDAPRMVDKIQKGLEDNDAASVHINAHSLKSNAADFGALDLSELCRQIENIAKSGTLRDVPGLYTRMQDELHRSEAALLDLLASRVW